MTNTALHALPFADYQRPTQDGPRIALVGEAPGAEEARLGMPFVGRSGRMLDEGLAAAGIARSACLVANVFRRQPPGNKVGHFFASRARAKREGRALDERWGAFGSSDRLLADFSGEIEALRDALAGFAPTVIVAVGRTPTWALTGQNGILSLRGSPLPCRLLDGPSGPVPVIPTFHPSYLMRGNWHEVPLFHADLQRARELASG